MNPPGSTASLDDWLEWQMTLAPTEIDLGLERVAEVLVVGDPQPDGLAGPAVLGPGEAGIRAADVGDQPAAVSIRRHGVQDAGWSRRVKR